MKITKTAPNHLTLNDGGESYHFTADCTEMGLECFRLTVKACHQLYDELQAIRPQPRPLDELKQSSRDYAEAMKQIDAKAVQFKLIEITDADRNSIRAMLGLEELQPETQDQLRREYEDRVQARLWARPVMRNAVEEHVRGFSDRHIPLHMVSNREWRGHTFETWDDALEFFTRRFATP